MDDIVIMGFGILMKLNAFESVATANPIDILCSDAAAAAAPLKQ